tara:strand:- start:754 stop:963 length:210 start_codon:yes stop_codon:yes gene_type:complete
MMAIPEDQRPTVRLVGEDGNAFAIMGRVTKALRRAGFDNEVVKAYQKEATSGDYDNLLRVTLGYVREED